MAWQFVGVSAAVTVTTTAHALTEPAGVAPGDLLVAVISSRIASTTSISLPAGWTLVAESKTNNVVAAATTSEASGMMAYIVRGASAPALTFTHPTAPSVAMGRIVAYRGNTPTPFDVGIGAKTGTAITAVSTTGLTTGQANELIVKGVCSGRASAFSAHDAATDPTTSSGAGAVQTAAPIVGTWQERQDSSTTTGADTALAIADAIRGTAGATGALTCTASVSGGHAQVAGAFKMFPFGVSSGSGTTVNTTIPATVSGDVIIVAGLANSTAPTVQTAGGQSAVFAKIGDMTSPRKNPGKQPNFVGIITNPAVGTTTVTLTAGSAGETELACWVVSGFTNPVQDIGQWGAYQITAIGQSGLSPTLAVANEFAVGFNFDPTTGLNTSEPGTSGFVLDAIATYGGYSHKVCTATTPIQAAFASGGSGGCTSLVTYRSTPPAAPAAHPFTLVEYQCTGTLGTTLTINLDAATQAGDAIFVAGESDGNSSAVGISVQTNNGDPINFGSLNSRRSPLSGTNRTTFVGTITPTTGSTSVTYSTTGSNYKGFAVWVVRGMSTPVQDKGVSVADQTPGDSIAESGLTGTLTTANEFAIGACSQPHTWELRTDQTGSDGFKLDSFCPTTDGGFAHQFTTTTGSIQSAWEVGGPSDVLTASYLSGAATAGTSSIAQTGSKSDFSISSAANSGTVSSTITVPSDAQMVCVGLKGWSGEADYFTNMTFTKGGADTAMTRVGQVESGNGHIAAIFYLVLPDTGTNKSLKFDWAGTNAPGEAPLASVTFWKGIDTASPVRSTGTSVEALEWNQFSCQTENILTAQDGDRVIAFAGGDNPGSDGTVDSWLNLNLLTQCTKSADRHDGAWATFSPSADLYVGALTSTGMTYGSISAIVLKPGATGVTGTLDVTDSPDTAFTTFTGTVENRGVLDVTDTADTAAFTGTVAWLAILDATDTADTAAFTGTVEWQGILFATDDPDTAAFTGTVENRGILDATDSPDTADFTGVVLIEVTGVLDATDLPDTAAFTGDLTAYTEGILDATDLPDIASFAGTVFTDVTGVLDATDIPDTAAFTGQVISSGILDATDLPDIAAFTGNIFDVVTGILDATEDADTASFISDVTNFGILNVTDSPDIAAFTGEVITSGVLNATDTPDTADFTGTITAIVPFSQVCIIG